MWNNSYRKPTEHWQKTSDFPKGKKIPRDWGRASVHGTLSRINHILGHKSSLGKLKKIEIISSIFSNHNAMRLDINYRKKRCKKYKHMEDK